jgi:phage terminase large subunit-like protein
MISATDINNYLYNYRSRYLYYKPTEKQKLLHNSTKNAFEIGNFGANRTGKTMGAAQQAAYFITGRYPSFYDGHRFEFAPNGVCLANNAQDIREIWQDYLFGGPITNGQGFIPDDLIVKKIYSNKGVLESIHVKHESGGIAQCQFKTYGQGVDKMQGKRYNFAFIDEEPDSLELYHEILLRLMDTGDGKGQGIMILTMTPKKGMTNLVSYFMNRKIIKDTKYGKTEEEYYISPESLENGKIYFHTDWNETHFLSEESKERYLANIPPHLIDCVTRGLPVFGDGLIYPAPEDQVVIEPFDIPNHFLLFNGMDFGFEDHTAVVFFAYDRDNDTIYVYKEYKVNHLTIEQHIPPLYAMGCDKIPTICDPYQGHNKDDKDSVSRVEKYQQGGLKLIVSKRNKQTVILESIRDRMRRGTFKIFYTCKRLLNEKRSYVTVDGKIKKGNDHLMNAMEYGMTLGLKYALNKNTIESNVTSIRKYRF